jgi:hypothetical protein
MEDQTKKQRVLTRVIRWTARGWSVASIGLMLLLLVGEGLNPSSPTEWVGLLFFPFGISAAMILAWWKEGLGGGITVGSLLVFYMIHLATAGTFPKGWGWLVVAAPGFLFLLCWHRSRKARTAAA